MRAVKDSALGGIEMVVYDIVHAYYLEGSWYIGCLYRHKAAAIGRAIRYIETRNIPYKWNKEKGRWINSSDPYESLRIEERTVI